MKMIQCGDSFKGIDLSDSFWADIDTYTDLFRAEQMSMLYSNMSSEFGEILSNFNK